jgi:transposase
MFIRRCVKHDVSSGQTYYFYQLVESYRTERGPRQRVMLNLGADLSLEGSERKELANRIEEIYSGQQPLFTYSEKIERLAQKFAPQLVRKQLIPSVTACTSYDLIHESIPDYATIDLNTLSNEFCRTIGAESIVLHFFNKLGLPGKLKTLGFSESQINLAASTIIGRAVYPKSELSTFEWLQEKTALDELLEVDFQKLKLNQLYKVSDMLWDNRKSIEDHLAITSKHIFGLEEKIILYDITNTHMEGLANANPKAKYGRSKQKRSDSPLVAFGIVLDCDGFPKRSDSFDGNVAETKTFIKMIRSLETGDTFFKPIIVVDAGIASDANLKWCRDNNYPYVVVSKRKTQPMPVGAPTIIVTAEGGDEVRVASVKDTKTNELLLYCESDARGRREKRIKSRSEQYFEQGLQAILDGLSRPRGTKQYNKVCERIGRLKEKHKKVAAYYIVDIDWDKTTDKTTNIKWKKNEEAASKKFTGAYCLRSYATSLTEDQLWKVYMMLTRLEETFRTMKSELGMRPIYHHKEHRVDGHIFISLLAYHLINAARHILAGKNIHLSWGKIREKMATQQRLTTVMKEANGETLYIRNTSKPEPFHKEIYEALGMHSQPLKNSRVNEKIKNMK